jgi:hypothetical protein
MKVVFFHNEKPLNTPLLLRIGGKRIIEKRIGD